MIKFQGVLTGQTDLLLELEPFRILIRKRVTSMKVTQMMTQEILEKVMSFLTLMMFVTRAMRNTIYQCDNVKIVW